MLNIEDIRLYTLEEIAPVLGVSKQTLLNYIRAGKLKAKKIGREWKITGEMLKEYLDNAESTPRKNRKNTDPEKRRKEVYELAEGLYSIMNSRIRPKDKERWKETVYNNVKDKSEEAYNSFVKTTKEIISLPDEQE